MQFLHTLLALVLASSLYGCLPNSHTEEATETFFFPSGEILINESFLSVGFDRVWHNTLFFQQNAKASREKLVEITEEIPAAVSFHTPPPRIEKWEDRIALLIGSHVFQRWLRQDGPYWYHTTSQPDPAASVFLRTFLPAEQIRRQGTWPQGTYEPKLGWLNLPRPNVTYAPDHVDLEQNVFVTRLASPDARFPEFLVYSASRYGFTWRFDIERTRSANHLAPPPMSDLWIDFSVITFPGDHRLGHTRESARTLPDAKEIHAQSLPLSASTWTPSRCSLTIPDGALIELRYDVLLGYADPVLDCVSIFWRRHPVLWDDWYFARLNDWVEADASGYNGDVALRSFFRVRRANLPEALDADSPPAAIEETP